MVEENIGQEFRLKNIAQIRNYSHEEIEHNELMNRTHKNIWKTLNLIEHFLNLATISVFQFLFLLLYLVFL